MSLATDPALVSGGRSRGDTRFLILVALTTVTAMLYWEGNIAHNLLWDEGFLWYGVQRVLLGEVPIRDFMAYDPARYYWSAAIAYLLGDDSVLAIRFACALCQFVGIFVGLRVVIPMDARTSPSHIMLSAIMLGLWIYPQYKVFDHTISILLIAAFAHLISAPGNGSYFLAGSTIGIAAFIGRNHGLYSTVAGMAVIVYLALAHRSSSMIKGLAMWSVGIAVGYSPMFAMFLWVPGFAHAFWEKSVRVFFEYRATNLALPIPWPWVVDINLPWPATIQHTLIGLLFVATLTYGILGLAVVARSILRKPTLPPIFVATVFLALPYTHYAFSRADIYHLALGIFPLLIGLIGLALSRSTFIKDSSITALFVLTILTILPQHPGWLSRLAGNWPTLGFGNSMLVVDPGTAGAMKSVAELAERYTPNGENFVVTPFWPGAYAAFRRKSPMWENYALIPRSETFQRDEIDRIKQSQPRFILVFDYALDQRQEHRFSATHPIINQFFRNNFLAHQVEKPGNPFNIYVSR